MFERIKEIFYEKNFLTPKDLLQLASVFKFRQIKKNEHFVKEGEYNYSAVKVIKGLLAHYIIDVNGERKILLFVPEKKFSGALQTTISKKAADENIIALEDSLILICDIRQMEKLAMNNIRILKLMNESYKEIILEAALRIKFLIENNEEKRYLIFTKTYPNLGQRVKQKDLASFLGITVSSLSRIRSRIVKRKQE